MREPATPIGKRIKMKMVGERLALHCTRPHGDRLHTDGLVGLCKGDSALLRDIAPLFILPQLICVGPYRSSSLIRRSIQANRLEV